MRRFSLGHPLATAVLNTAAGLLIAFAFARGELSTWVVEMPLQLAVLLIAGLLVALMVAKGVSRLPISIHPSSPFQRLAISATFGVLLGLVGTISGFAVASVSLWGLAVWFPTGAAVMTIHSKVRPRGNIPHG